MSWYWFRVCCCWCKSESSLFSTLFDADSVELLALFDEDSSIIFVLIWLIKTFSQSTSIKNLANERIINNEFVVWITSVLLKNEILD